jgi:predicted transcriptional regulator
MPNMTIRVPDDLKRALDEHPEINWSEVARQSMWDYLRKLRVADEIAAESELTEADAEELSEELKRDVAEHYRDG